MVCVFWMLSLCVLSEKTASQPASQPLRASDGGSFLRICEKEMLRVTRETQQCLAICSIPKRKPSVYIERERILLRTFQCVLCFCFWLLLLLLKNGDSVCLDRMLLWSFWLRAVTKRVSVSCVLLWLWYVFIHIQSEFCVLVLTRWAQFAS